VLSYDIRFFVSRGPYYKHDNAIITALFRAEDISMAGCHEGLNGSVLCCKSQHRKFITQYTGALGTQLEKHPSLYSGLNFNA